jgi:hypothetical protein
MSAVLTHPEIEPQRPHCMAGLGGLEPANVVLKRPLKSWVNSYLDYGAARKFAALTYLVAMRRKSLRRQNMRWMALRSR